MGKTEEYYHDKSNIGVIYGPDQTPHYVDASKKQGVLFICLLVGVVAVYFICKQLPQKKQDDQNPLLNTSKDEFYDSTLP
ncbi:unnamed protein product [Oikopleura dioica]|uniref:Uncharacterized protein n=1 Tax=Oikopleura dioica TaxID=34765 RepID=E4YL61_OIKDI|nr:unnamed protein product [Oikopleura dioica]CBY40709.1 unnamed protein product [Oikopleura dioica]